MNAIIFSIILFLMNCTSRPGADANVQTSTDTIGIAATKDSLNKIIHGELVVQIPVRQFFKEGSINDIGYGETSLRYLMPLTFYKDLHHFYIPDRSRLSLRVLDAKGKVSSPIKIPLKDFTFYKIDRVDSHWYFLDIEKGLSVLSDQTVIEHGDEKTVDFHVDEGFKNIYLENMLNDERALLDQKGVLKEPLKIDYLNSFIDSSILFGISDKGENRYTIVRRDLKDNSESEYVSFTTSCSTCFIMPSFLDEHHIISSIDNPSVRDQVTIINQGESSANHYLLEYPFKVNRLVSDVSAGVSYSGYMYFYDQESKVLYSLCTDKEFIRIFSFDLNQLEQH